MKLIKLIPKGKEKIAAVKIKVNNGVILSGSNQLQRMK